MREKIELLAPAGDMERLKMAVAYGADAVYLAGNTFGMRSFAGNFSPEELAAAVALCHSKGVRVHVTCNTMPRNDEAARLPEWMEYLSDVGVDAVILADVGVLSQAKKYAPNVECHISTQASIVNYISAQAWYDLGAGDHEKAEMYLDHGDLRLWAGEHHAGIGVQRLCRCRGL